MKHFVNQLIEQTNQNVIKVPKVVGQRIRNRYNKTLGTCVINSPMSPSSVIFSKFLIITVYCYFSSKTLLTSITTLLIVLASLQISTSYLLLRNLHKKSCSRDYLNLFFYTFISDSSRENNISLIFSPWISYRFLEIGVKNAVELSQIFFIIIIFLT